MPGVPPDAVAQLKKGFRGLFGRRKSKDPKPQQSQPSATPASNNGPTSTTTAPGAAPVAAAGVTQGSENRDSNLPPPPQSAAQDLNKAPQLSSPVTVGEANAIDLNPLPSDAAMPNATTVPEPSPGAPAQPSTGLNELSTKPDTEATPVSNNTPSQMTTEPSPEMTATIPKATPAPPPTSTGMSATSGPMGDHMTMAEAYVDDDENVGPKGEKLVEGGKIEEPKAV